MNVKNDRVRVIDLGLGLETRVRVTHKMTKWHYAFYFIFAKEYVSRSCTCI